MEKEQKIEVIKKSLSQVLLPDCLRPEFDGMSLREISAIVLRELDRAQVLDSPELYDHCYCGKCGGGVQCYDVEGVKMHQGDIHVKSLCGNCI